MIYKNKLSVSIVSYILSVIYDIRNVLPNFNLIDIISINIKLTCRSNEIISPFKI